jgi:Tfp pilus assembly protein PilZ
VADNRRIQTRHEVAIPAKLIVDGTTAECTMLNLSVGGALVTVTTKYAMGQRVQVAFHVPTIGEVIEVGATVRWSSSEGVGVQFDGLRARDVWALQAYFKQLPT